jgi:pseudaminic acid cytidylyltransferase
MSIAIIPARSGSTRIKNKNIKIFNGKPIIAWSIIAAKKSKIFSKIVVSTDSKKIANIAKKYGAEIFFLRPKSLASNNISITDVMKHSVSFLSKIFKSRYYCCIYATAPFLEQNDLIKAYKIIKKKKIDFVLSVSKFESSIFRALTKKNNYIFPLFKKNAFKNSQDLPKTYFDCGQFIFGRSESWLLKKHAFLSKSSYVEIPKWRSQDINDPSDWEVAKKMYKLNNINK